MPQDKIAKDVVALECDALQQGELYICKIKWVKLALFEGWNDDMCCFRLLREDASPMRWSEARYVVDRYLPGEFIAYDAFDSLGNPPLSLWDRTLGTKVPRNWFEMFEEARRKQRVWAAGDDDLVPPPHIGYELHRIDSPGSAATPQSAI
ncbi:hypothetical protein BC938DRAFT_473002 [Jimgerdemannia flammicorona]|uniref:Uncharacterized protein n=1 Tax=Jimgerdemannia flammicorona TaxID=994334 RepID=A0A433Q4Z0_9FUNG|nr:hypothetical protein BC938DRAFT_473002 [Jimgerdemannia flammicorona]